jgi:SOS-response transcriptional repressor LexA
LRSGRFEIHLHGARALGKAGEKRALYEGTRTKPRAIEILDSSPLSIARDLVEVPIVGKVTAGQPILAVENIEDSFPLPADFLRGSDNFILVVKGESMIEAGILRRRLRGGKTAKPRQQRGHSGGPYRG